MVYVNSLSQISVQKPLCDEWATEPQSFAGERLVRCNDPDFKQFFPANIIRRNSKVLRRAMLVANDALQKSGLQSVDGVFTGSGLGCVESTETFLQDLVYNGEEYLKPTPFMQSTHNTIGSVIGIALKCHGYNSTYCQNAVSFESAMLDAYLQLTSNKISSAFVCGFDEMSPTYHAILCNSGYYESGNTGFAGESAAGAVLSTQKGENAFCSIESIQMVYTKDINAIKQTLQNTLNDAGITINNISAIMTGINGNPKNDLAYRQNIENLGINAPILGFAQLFGECFSASVYGFYTSAYCLKHNKIYAPLILNGDTEINNPEYILLYRHSSNKNHTFILLKKC